MKTTALISFTFLAIAGCVTDAEVPEDPTATDIVKTPFTGSCLGTSFLGGTDTYVTFVGAATTEDLSSYNPSTAPCLPGKWVVEVDGTAGKAPTPYVHYAGPRLANATACSNASVYGQVFGHLASGWVAVGGPDSKNGTWTVKGCSLTLSFPQAIGYDRIAVAGVAYSDQAFHMVNVTNGAD